MSKGEKVVFFFPWKEVSGGPLYLSNLANDLACDKHYDVWYTDYEPGLSDTMLSNRVQKIVYSEPFTFPILEPVTLITPIYCASFIPKLHPVSKIVLVNWHNYCTQAVLDIWRLSAKGLQKYLKLIYENDALFFLDRAHLLAQNEWIRPKGAYQFPERYVPPKVLLSDIRCKEELVRPGEVNIAVLGRLCTDKIFSVLNFLEQLEQLNNSSIKNVYIIGSGKEANRITDRTWSNNIALHMMGTITGDELKRFLAEKADILFSMGMSVLEGARIGLPAVIMPHNTQPFRADAYAYLCDSKGYAVGWYNTQIEAMDIPVHTLSEVLSSIYEKGQKATLGRATLAYLEKNHMSNVAFLKERINASTLRYKEFRKFARHQGYIRLFGLPVARLKTSFDYSEKRISVLGMDRFLQCKITPDKKEVFLFGKPQKRIIVNKDEDTNTYRIYIRVPFIKA